MARGVVRRTDKERVTVSRLLGGIGCPDGAPGPAFVLDQHALAELRVELRSHRSCEGIGAAAGRKRHDEDDGPLWPALRPEF